MEYKLEEICEFIRNGANIKQSENAGGYPITRIETIANSFIDVNRMGYANIEELEKYEGYLLIEGDILMSHINSEKHLGKTAIFENINKEVIHGMNLLCLRPDKEIVLPKYLNYYFNNIIFRNKLHKITKKSVNQASFSVTDLKKIELQLPLKNKQENIVHVLDKAQKLIDKRKKQIEELDELVKSRFIEMFGDLKGNTKHWYVLEFDEFATIDTNMTKDFEKYKDYPHIGIECIEKNTGRILDYKLVKDSDLKSGKYLFDNRHIIYSKIRPNLNKVALPSFIGVCSADSYPILCNEKITTRSYLGYVLRSEFFLNYILAFSGRTNIPKVNKDQLRGFKMPTPPIELQNQFANFVKQVDKLKFEMENSLKELEDNFNSLMQKAFNGELFN